MRFKVSSTSDINIQITKLKIQMSHKKPTIFAPTKIHRVFFLAQLLQPYYGSHPEHHFPQLDDFPQTILQQTNLRKLYDLTIDNLNVHNYQDAIFFCDKLLTLSSAHPAAVYLLAQCLFRNGDYKKVHSLFQQHKLLTKNSSFQLLAARALLLNKQYEQCLGVIDAQLDNTYCNKKMEGCKAYIKGQCYEAQENKQMAVECYFEAVTKDPTHVEAFSRLVDCQLLTGIQKQQLLSNIDFSSEYIWLKKIYLAKVKPGQQMMQQQSRRQGQGVYESLVSLQNINILCIKANTLYQSYQISGAYELCLKAIKKDPLCFQVLPVYATCLLHLNLVGDLYYCAHNLVQNYSNHPVSWFTVGAYYFLCKKYEVARKYFQKAIILDKSFLYAWVGMAHSFAVQDQSDQAMSIYRTIVRLFPGCAQAHLYMGMEYLRTNNLKTATLSLQKAKEINPSDPLIYSQLGVIHYKQKNYKQACRLQQEALSLCHPEAASWVRETIITNLAHSYRKMKDLKNSLKHLQQCVSLNPSNAQTYFSLGFTYHLNNNYNKAICYYHKALKYKHDNQFAQEMLQKALTDSCELPWDHIYMC